MIVNVVGAMGAGKTTLLRQLIERHGAAPMADTDQMVGYQGIVAGRSFFVVGPYHRACGGCDSFTADLVRRHILWAGRRFDHVLFEGMFVTTAFRKYAAFLREISPGRHAFAFLHPPLDVCVRRVLDRRLARGGNHRPLCLANARAKHQGVTRSLNQARDCGIPFVLLNWKRPLPQLERLLEVSAQAA